MTAEVVVMNRLGVALASDSAASVLVGGRTKLYHADKLFMLSNVRPVAVMVYNSSSLLQVPWETIVKSFRAELGGVAYAAAKEQTEAAQSEFLSALGRSTRDSIGVLQTGGEPKRRP